MPLPLQVVPEGIESINGSVTSIGCEVALVQFGDVTYCGVYSMEGGSRVSYLVDNVSPAIYTGNLNWASLENSVCLLLHRCSPTLLTE